jgi:hypothetical protein
MENILDISVSDIDFIDKISKLKYDDDNYVLEYEDLIVYVSLMATFN